jgi:RNA polymerase sigma factor (sigma-70 family)
MAIINLWSPQRSKQAQFDQLVKPHLKKLYQLAYRFTGNPTDAEDMVQDVMLKLYPKVDELAQIEKPGPWLARILYRHNIDAYRKKQRSALDQSDNDDSYNELENKHAQPAEVTESTQTQAALTHALNQLTAEQKDLIILHDVEGYTLVEIKQILDTPIGTLKSRLSRSRTKLREMLAGMEPSDETQRVSQ